MKKATDEQIKRFVELSNMNTSGKLTDEKLINEWKELKPLCWKDKRSWSPLFENERCNKDNVKFIIENGRVYAEKEGLDFGTVGKNGASWEASTKELNDYILSMKENTFFYSFEYLSNWLVAQN